MIFVKYQNRLFLIKFIRIREIVFISFCEYCHLIEKDCIVMTNQKKCVEYICRNRFCVLTSFETLNHVYEKLQTQLQIAKNELACVFSKINCLRKQIKLNKLYTIQKIQCVVVELSNDNDDFDDEIVVEFLSLF